MADKKKKKSEPEEFQSDPSVVLFVALGMILLAFFIVLNSIAVIDESHVKEALGSLIGSFGILGGGLRVESGSDFFPMGAPMASSVEEGAASLALELQKMTERWEEGAKRTFDLKIQMGKDIIVKKGRVIMTFADRTAFSPGSAELRPAFLTYLSAISRILRRSDFPVTVEGYTDDLPIHTEAYSSNWELSTARAVSVVRHFIEVEKISMYRLKAVGYGEHMPLFPNTSPENRARNRRCNIIIDLERDSLERIRTMERTNGEEEE